ncbi:hypothetical protein TNCV_817781 [Trichonephila clavipes]|nr:hypothetical protein TNCV_817781 [Trichonephila clavipes]
MKQIAMNCIKGVIEISTINTQFSRKVMQMAGTRYHRRPRRNHEDDFTRVKMIRKLQVVRSLTSVAEEFGTIKCPFERLESLPNHRQICWKG